MPTVLSVTLALGAYQLAKQGAIVARMSAVEEMAGVCPARVQWTGGVWVSMSMRLGRRQLVGSICQQAHLVLGLVAALCIDSPMH